MNYIESTKSVFKQYKLQAEKAMAQVNDAALNWQAGENSNSIAAIVKHLWGNMMSRWTDFLTSDGEKPWRERDDEFEPGTMSREQLMKLWNEGWACMFTTLDGLTDADLDRIVCIRTEGLTVLDAVTRQIAHYASHVGQIIYIAKMQADGEWNSLSIPKNMSKQFNAGMFANGKTPNQ